MSPNELVLGCSGASATISAFQFASYGNPTGSCGGYSLGSCNAANSTAIVEAACVGQHACTVWPNTTTFGDPCFGTAKTLVVQFTCSDGGSGSATCEDGPPPPPPPTKPASATVDFSTALDAGVTLPSLQVVSQRLLLPWSGPIYSNAWAGLANLTAKGLASVRFVPWLPYPKVRVCRGDAPSAGVCVIDPVLCARILQMGVAELDPPSGNLLCGPRMWALGQSFDFALDCGADGGTIAAVDFASYGNAAGVCGAYSVSGTSRSTPARCVTLALPRIADWLVRRCVLCRHRHCTVRRQAGVRARPLDVQCLDVLGRHGAVPCSPGKARPVSASLPLSSHMYRAMNLPGAL